MSRPLAQLGEAAFIRAPRGTREIQPRPCRGCAGTVWKRGFSYCDDCRAARCTTCHGQNGYHSSACTSKPGARRCRGCGSSADFGSTAQRFCGECRAQTCPECQRYGGAHAVRCLWLHRTRRLPLTTHYGVVSQEDIAELFARTKAKAIGVAMKIVDNRADAEDAVMQTVLYIVERREFLRDLSERYFLKSVKHAALRSRQTWWARNHVALDPSDLIIAEAATHPARTRHRDRGRLVRLA